MRTISFAIIIALFAGLFFSCESEKKSDNNYTINLTVSNADDVMSYLIKRRDGEMITIDSTQLKEGKGNFSGNIGLPEFYYISIEGARAYAGVFVEPGDIAVKLDMNNPRDLKVDGSSSHKTYDDFNASLSEFDVRIQEIVDNYNEARGAGDEEKMKEAENNYNAVDKEKSAFTTNYVKQNNGSVVSAYLVMRNSYQYNVDELDAFVTSFDPSISSSYYVKYLSDRVTTLKRVAVGQPFVDFELDDVEGNPVSLSSVAEGKYLLVDFWAAWCRPCRAENPNVVKAYNKYHEKGFDVLGVSFDENHAKWVEAIEKDGLIWHQISDLKGWGSAAGKLYGIQSIPQNILINPEGIIIEKNLRGEDLQKKLAEIFTGS
jgi:peroxiredoxin